MFTLIKNLDAVRIEKILDYAEQQGTFGFVVKCTKGYLFVRGVN